MVIFSKLRRGRFPRNVEKLVLDLAGVLPHVVRADGQCWAPEGIAVLILIITVYVLQYCILMPTWFSILSSSGVYHKTVL